jgi:hypothetical protein
VRIGVVGINDYGPDFVAPFGANNASGIDRELRPEGLALETTLPPPTAALPTATVSNRPHHTVVASLGNRSKEYWLRRDHQ